MSCGLKDTSISFHLISSVRVTAVKNKFSLQYITYSSHCVLKQINGCVLTTYYEHIVAMIVPFSGELYQIVIDVLPQFCRLIT